MNAPYILPHSTELQSLEFEWERYDQVWFYSSSRSLKEASVWFGLHLPRAKNSNPDEGKLEFNFSDAHDMDWSILVADACNRPALNDLTAYVGSTRLTQLAAATHQGVVVVLFQHKKPARKK